MLFALCPLFSMVLRKVVGIVQTAPFICVLQLNQASHASQSGDHRALLRHVSLAPELQLALLDAVATFEVCACSLECWPVRAAFGHTGLLVAIALNGVRAGFFSCRDAYGNPCNPWYR